MGLKLITPPSVDPVTAAEAKVFLPALSGTADATISAWIKAATQSLDGWSGKLGRALITQTWELQVDAFPYDYGTEIRLPLVPVQSVSSIKYDDADGIEQTVLAADWYVDSTSEPAWVFPVEDETWPTPLAAANSVRVRFVAGYGATGADVPGPIKQAIVLSVAMSQSLMGQNLFIRSETVEGVGSTDYSGGSQASSTIADQIERLIAPYRSTCGIS